MDYRQLGFYQKARQVVAELDVEIKCWPKTMQAQEIARQLFRAATSVGANIAEGHGRHIGKEYSHYLIIAQGSANEVDHWLNTVLDCKIGNSEKIQQLLTLTTEIRKMLQAAINSLNQKRAIREETSPYSPSPLTSDSASESNLDSSL